MPPIPKPATEKAAPVHVPEAEPEPNDPVFPPGIEEPGDSWESSRRAGGERTRPDVFDANPEWKTMGQSLKEDGHTALTLAQCPFSNDPNHALQRILVLRARGRHVGAEPIKLRM